MMQQAHYVIVVETHLTTVRERVDLLGKFTPVGWLCDLDLMARGQHQIFFRRVAIGVGFLEIAGQTAESGLCCTMCSESYLERCLQDGRRRCGGVFRHA